MKSSSYLLTMTSIVSFSVFAADNAEPDNDQLLLASCQALTTTPEQMKAKHCIYFIQGFLAATQAIDPSIIKRQSKKRAEFYGFMSRPHRNWDQIPPIRFLPFCLPEDESEDRIIKTISKQLSPQIDTAKMLRDRIFRTLKAEYPCGQL